MIRAAVDGRGSFPGIVVADDRELPLQPLAAASVQLVEYVDLPAERQASKIHDQRVGGTYNKRIEVSDERIQVRASQMVHLMLERGVERVAIEAPSKREHSGRFVSVLKKASETAGIAVATVNTPWPIVHGTDDTPALIREHFALWYPPKNPKQETDSDGWCEAGDFGATRDAARVLLADLGLVKAPVPVDRTAKSEGALPVEHLGTVAEPKPSEVFGTLQVPESSGRPRILGIDTGRTVGVCVAESATDEKFSKVAAFDLDVDLSDQEKRREFASGLQKLIQNQRVARVVVEQVLSVHGGDVQGNREHAIAAIRAMATGLVQANWLGGIVEAVCFALGVAVDTVPAAQWRRRIIQSKTTPSDAQVAALVRSRFVNWEHGASEHQCDAAGLILWAEAAKAPRKRSADSTARSNVNATERRTEKRAAERAAGGCICDVLRAEAGNPPLASGQSRGHIKGCPMFKRRAVKAYRQQLCRVCGQPKAGHVCPGISHVEAT